MFVINIGVTIAVTMQIRAARGHEMIVVRVIWDIGANLSNQRHAGFLQVLELPTSIVNCGGVR